MASSSQPTRLNATLVLVTLLTVSAALPLGTVLAGSSPSASITSPADGSTFARLDTVFFQESSSSLGCGTLSRTWDFGDGGTSTISPSTRQYTTLGAMVVTLTVQGTKCATPSITQITIHIQNALPVADLTAPATVVAGQTLTLSAGGSSDRDGSIASYDFTVDGVAVGPQASSTHDVVYTAVGTHSAQVTVTDNDGASATSGLIYFEVVPDAVWDITVSPATATLTPTASETFSASGVDQYSNPVSFTPVWASTCGSITAEGVFTAPSAVQTCSVTASSGDAQGAADVTIIAGSLASISITGPDSLVANTDGTFELAGFDAYGNPVPLNAASVLFTAPTRAGAATVTYEQDGIVGQKEIAVVPASLARIDVSGPATLVVDTEGEYAVAGYDAYDNAVALAVASVIARAPQTVGAFTVTYVEGDVTGSLSVEATHGALATIIVSGPGAVPAGSSTEYGLAGLDAFGNSVPLSQSTTTFEAPLEPGYAVVSYTEEGVTGTLDVEILTVELGVSVQTTQASYGVAEAVLGGVNGVVNVAFPGHGALAGATVQVEVVRDILGILTRVYTAEGETDADGNFAFSVPVEFTLPGEFTLSATAAALGHAGDATGSYAVTL